MLKANTALWKYAPLVKQVEPSLSGPGVGGGGSSSPQTKPTLTTMR